MEGHLSDGALCSVEVKEICLLELVSPRMQASLQTLKTVLSSSGSTTKSIWATVRDCGLGPNIRVTLWLWHVYTMTRVNHAWGWLSQMRDSWGSVLIFQLGLILEDPFFMDFFLPLLETDLQETLRIKWAALCGFHTQKYRVVLPHAQGHFCVWYFQFFENLSLKWLWEDAGGGCHVAVPTSPQNVLADGPRAHQYTPAQPTSRRGGMGPRHSRCLRLAITISVRDFRKFKNTIRKSDLERVVYHKFFLCMGNAMRRWTSRSSAGGPCAKRGIRTWSIGILIVNRIVSGLSNKGLQCSVQLHLLKRPSVFSSCLSWSQQLPSSYLYTFALDLQNRVQDSI